MSVRYLTKSRFKIGYECPTKLQYQDDKKFGNLNVENSFLASSLDSCVNAPKHSISHTN
jgi:hypothetical protein